MWSWDPSTDGQVRGRKEAELARYFKLEYGEAEIERLLAETRVTRPPSPGRFWAGLRQRVATRRQNGTAAGAASASSDGATPAKDLTPQKLPTDCRHGEWETLGSGGSSTYLRCGICGALVVSQGGRLWSFARDRPEGI